jgi:mannosyltransferase
MVVAFALLAGAIAVRIAVIDRSLWLDETISVLQVDRPWLQVISGQVNNVHPPLFHLVLHAWTVLFGTAAATMRVLSILWSLVAVGAMWGWSREAFPSVSPVPAAALAAFSPFAVWYATEVRMYAQLLALVALSGWLAWRMLNHGATPWRMIGLIVALTATAYTHYFAMLFVASLASSP